METIELKMKTTVFVRLPFNQENAKIVIEIINANANLNLNTNADRYKCKHCKHEWIPKKDEQPKVCPKCNYPDWNKPDADDNKELKDNKILVKSPNNTALFLNWLEDQHVSEFNIDDFVNKYSSINREHAEKIVAHQIHLGRLIQLSKDRIRVVKKPPYGSENK